MQIEVKSPPIRTWRLPSGEPALALHVDGPLFACAFAASRGVPLLSQSVLLRGVNDDPAVLGALLRALVECRVKPYYLHHADLAPGTARFRTGIAEGQALMRALRGHYSGLCQPTYVLDLPGGHGKSPVGPSYLDERTGRVRDYTGVAHAYAGE